MTTIYNTYTQFLDSGAGETELHEIKGRILAILASTSESSVQTVIFLDKDDQDEDTLFKLCVSNSQPAYIEFQGARVKPKFTRGLSVNPASARVFVVTEI